MFDMGFAELLVVFIVALLVIGPERLPHAARLAGKYVGKLKSVVNGIRTEVEREIRAEELKEKMLKELEAHGVEDARQQIEETFQHSSVAADEFKQILDRSIDPEQSSDVDASDKAKLASNDAQANK